MDWNRKFGSFFQQFRFNKYSCKHGVYVKNTINNDILVVCLYVDEFLVTKSNEEIIKGFKDRMKGDFEIANLGLLPYFL